MSRDRLAQLIFIPIALYVALLFGLAVFVVHPPLLGFIGLVVVGIVASLAGALALAFFSRMRTNADRLHPRSGSVYRLLVVTDAEADPAELRSAVALRAIGRRTEVRVIAPVIASPVHFLAADDDRERSDAARRLRATVSALAQAGIPVQGAIGTDDPLQAVGDTLGGFPADEILLVGRMQSARSWLDRDFERRARDLFGIPVSTLLGPATERVLVH